MNVRHKLFAAYLVMVIMFAAWVLLDTFVIVKEYVQVEKQEILPVTEEHAQISIQKIRAYDTNIFVADIIVPDASFIRTAFAKNTYGKNVTASVAEMAEENKATLAINGDYYGVHSDGFVIRDGVLYREAMRKEMQEDLCIWDDGDMTLIAEDQITAQELLDSGARHVFCFGPALIDDGEIMIEEYTEIDPRYPAVPNPRTAIAMIEPLHYLFVVADGRTDESRGLLLYELAKVLQDLEVQVAYNMDGGGSSTMVYEGEVVNYPTGAGNYEERMVSDIVYIR